MLALYFIALVLPPPLDEQVKAWKLVMQRNFNCNAALKSPAHITLIPPFRLEENSEEDLTGFLDSFASRQQSFSTWTHHFAAFKPRTIFIDVKPSHQLTFLKKQLDQAILNKPEWNIKTDERPFHPHITIANRDLLKTDFAAAWQLVEKQEFIESWKAEGISLLKHNKKNWDVVHTSQFPMVEE